MTKAQISKRNWYEKNKDLCKLRSKIFYNKNKKRCLQLCKKYRLNNKEYIAQYQKKYIKTNKLKLKQYKKLYYQKNKELINKKVLNYLRLNINARLASNIRKRFLKALKHNYKRGSAVKDLGCSIEYFKTYIQNKFQPGMKWGNYGKWHLDHIKPLSSFDLKNKKHIKKACNYKNYQPLWAEDNIRKGAKYGKKNC